LISSRLTSALMDALLLAFTLTLAGLTLGLLELCDRV
jgi:hypothetical protein